MSDSDKGIRHQVLAGLVLVAAVCLFLLWQGGYLMPRLPPVQEENGFQVPEHHIPPEYFANAKPAVPISETEMVTIVISRQTYGWFSQADKPGILVVPVAYLDFTNNFTNTTLIPTWHEEKSLRPEEGVAMIRMPATMYDRFLADAKGPALELPESVFVRRFDNLSQLHGLITPDGRLVDPMVTGNGTMIPSEMPALPSTPRTPPTVIITTPRIYQESPMPGSVDSPHVSGVSSGPRCSSPHPVFLRPSVNSPDFSLPSPANAGACIPQ